jgi:hypothetical protein
MVKHSKDTYAYSKRAVLKNIVIRRQFRVLQFRVSSSEFRVQSSEFRIF